MEDGENAPVVESQAPGESVEVDEAPAEKIEYPLKVAYCGNCGLPPEVSFLDKQFVTITSES